MKVRVHHSGGYSYRGWVSEYDFPDYFIEDYFHGQTDFTEKEWEDIDKEFDERVEKK